MKDISTNTSQPDSDKKKGDGKLSFKKLVLPFTILMLGAILAFLINLAELYKGQNHKVSHKEKEMYQIQKAFALSIKEYAKLKRNNIRDFPALLDQNL